MRDTTGLRDMTTGGLQGVLNPPGVFDLYQKPTGGALVSLDPGWGPADERTWIKTVHLIYKVLQILEQAVLDKNRRLLARRRQ